MFVAVAILEKSPFSKTFVKRLPERQVKELVSQSLERPSGQRVNYLWSQLDDSNINAFLLQSYWPYFLNLQTATWSQLDRNHSLPLQETMTQEEDIADMAYYRCIADLHTGSPSRCWNSITPFPDQKIKMIFMASVKTLKIKEADRIYEIYFKGGDDSCPVKMETDHLLPHSVSYLFNLQRRFDLSSRCIETVLKKSSGITRQYLETELILTNLLSGDLSANEPGWNDFQPMNDTPFYQHQLLLVQLAWSIRQKKTTQITTLLSKMESLLKDTGMKYQLEQIKYIRENLNKPAPSLPRPTSYDTWVARTLLQL